MKFATAYEKNKKNKDLNTGERKMDSAGYVPANIRIENMINAGERLIQARKEQYDYNDPKEDDGYTMDPTRRLGFDLSDATRAKHVLEQNARAKESEKKLGEAVVEKIEPEPVVEPDDKRSVEKKE